MIARGSSNCAVDRQGCARCNTAPRRLLEAARLRVELQLAPAARGNGLGKFVMQLLELMATKHKMQFMMLTVFKINDGAMRFYLDKLKYSVDETSPSRCAVDDESSYEILSKCLDKSLIENAKQDADDLGPRLRS